MSLPEGVERRKVWLIGLDQVTVRGADNLRKVLACEEVERPTSEKRKLKDLPLWARWFFPVTRFYTDRFGWFLPLIPETDAAYPPCRKFLDSKFSQRAFLDEDVTAAVDLLEGEKPASDEDLVKVFVQAIYRSFNPSMSVPESVFAAANQQLFSPVESFLPWRRLPSARGTSTVYTFASNSRKNIPGAADLPDKCVVDIAHVRSHPACVLCAHASVREATCT